MKSWRTIECRGEEPLPWIAILEHTMVPPGEAKGAWKVFKALLPRTVEYRMVDQDGKVLDHLPKAKGPSPQ